MDLLVPFLLAAAALWLGWGARLCWQFREVLLDHRYEFSLPPFLLYWMAGPVLAPLIWLLSPLVSRIIDRKTAEPKRWDFFLSYSHWDCLWASALYGVIRFAGSQVFLDFVVINRGANWRPIAEKGIEESDTVLLLDSADSQGSANVNHEIEFRRRAYRNKTRGWKNGRVPDSSFPSNVAKRLPIYARRDGILTLGPICSLHPDWKYETQTEYHCKLIGNLPGWLGVNLPAVETLALGLGLPCPPRDVLEPLMTEYLVLAATGLTQSELEECNKQLLEAAERGDIEKVRELIEKCADVNTTTQLQNDTPLTLAAARGQHEVVQFLLESGAKVNAVGYRGRSALIWAAEQGHLGIVEDLLGAGAWVDLNDQQGMTALMRACKGGHAEVVKALVAAGADLNLRDFNNQTALYRARKKKYTDIIQILEKAGASE